MNVLDNKETRVRSNSWQSCDFNADIPIKKRRYHFIQPPSPLTEEPSSTPQENGSRCNQVGGLSQGSLNSNASNIATSAACSWEASENTVSLEKGSSDVYNAITEQKIVDHPKVEVKEPSLPVQSVSLPVVEIKGQFLEANTSNSITKLENFDRFKVKSEEHSLPGQSASLVEVIKREKHMEVEASNIFVGSAKTEMKIAPTEDIAEIAIDCLKFKTEEPSLTFQSVDLAGIENKDKLVVATSSNIPVSSAVQSVSLADVENREKLVEAKSSKMLVRSEETEMKSIPTVAVAHDMHSRGYRNPKVGGWCEPELLTGSRNAESPLGFREHLIQVMPGQSTGKSFQCQENLEPLSLDLSLREGEYRAQNESENSVYRNAVENNGVNRSNWNLNTTMENWEGSPDGRVTGKVSFVSSNTSSDTLNVKRVSYLDGMVSAALVSQDQDKEKVGCRSDNVTTSIQSEQQHNPGCSLSLGLSSYCRLEELSSSLSTIDTGIPGSNLRFSGPVMSGCASAINFGIVKSEAHDEVVRQQEDGSKGSPMKLTDIRVKCELVERCRPEGGFSNNLLSKSPHSTTVKPAPFSRVHGSALNKKEVSPYQSNKQMVQSSDIQNVPTSTTSNQPDKLKPHGNKSVVVSTCLTDMAMNPGASNNLESPMWIHSTQSCSAAHEKACKTVKQVGAEMFSSFVNRDDNNCNASGVTDSYLTEDKNTDDHEGCSLKFTDECPHDSCGTEEGFLSDEEKINLSGNVLEEHLYGSGCESDGIHDLSKTMNKKLDGGTNVYEDGEVRQAVTVTAVGDSSTKKSQMELPNYAESYNKNKDVVGLTADDFPNSLHFDERATEADLCETSNYGMKDSVDASHDEKLKNHDHEDACLIESLEMPTTDVEIKTKTLVQEFERKPLGCLEERDASKNQEREHSSDQVVHPSEGISVASLGSDENVNMVKKNISASNKPEVVSSSGDDLANVDNGGSSQSRIINLAQVSSKSPCKPLPTSSSSLSLRSGSNRLPDIPIEADNFLPKERDEDFINDTYKFSRERHHDQLTRNSRLNFISDKRGVSNRTNTNLRGRNSESKLAYKYVQSEFRVPRIKLDSDLMDADVEFFNYGNTREDGAFVRSFRRGRRLSNDEATFFSHSHSQRQPPRFSYKRRDPRNGNRGRSAAEAGSAFHSLRDGENFMRGLPRNNMGPVFRRPQRPYRDLDGHFVRGHKNFSSLQRSIPRFHSRSPTRSGPRSPGLCSSFRNRSPDGFCGHPDFPHRRSPLSYGMERIKSPDRPRFSGNMVVRRPGSPPYLSRPSSAIRDMNSGSGRGCGYLGSGISFRNPSGRAFLRNRGNFDFFDPQEKFDCDDFFERPMHSNRFDQFDVDGRIERRRVGDSRDSICSFEPSFGGDDFEPSVADDPGGVRFCEEDDAEIKERGNFREFDMRNKNCTGDAPRRTINIKEKEASSRHGRELWHDDGFDDIERAKRKRF